MTIAMDGNFGLVRKHNAGISPRPISTKNGFFIDSMSVDAFVSSYSDDKDKDKVHYVYFCIKV